MTTATEAKTLWNGGTGPDRFHWEENAWTRPAVNPEVGDKLTTDSELDSLVLWVSDKWLVCDGDDFGGFPFLLLLECGTCYMIERLNDDGEWTIIEDIEDVGTLPVANQRFGALIDAGRLRPHGGEW